MTRKIRLEAAAIAKGHQDKLMLGDFSRARSVLGWESSTSFEELVRMMVDTDLAAID